jgi:hypothetical protein
LATGVEDGVDGVRWRQESRRYCLLPVEEIRVSIWWSARRWMKLMEEVEDDIFQAHGGQRRWGDDS